MVPVVLQTTSWLPNTHTNNVKMAQKIGHLLSTPIGDDTPARPPKVSGAVARRHDLALPIGDDDDRDGAGICEAIARHAC